MDNHRKRLFYRATHRGMKETDAIIGGYATDNLAHMGDADLIAFERILDENDNDLMNWVLEREAIPSYIDGPTARNLIQYKKSL